MNTHIAYILLFISSIKAENLTELLQESTATLVKTATSNQQHQQQFIQILHTIIGAIKLSCSFFKSLFFLVYKCMTTVLSPIMWLTNNLWAGFVAKPYHLFMHVARVLYPVTLFCAAAIFCGLFIGGCAGFAAEAFSSILISATWGPQPKVIEEEGLLLVEDDDVKRPEETDEEEDEHIIKSSKSSSIWENSSSFFGVHQHKKKEKEPLVQKPKVELWRESIVDSPPPVMIRRMKLSSSHKKSGWDWDDEDDMCHPTSSSKKKHV